MTIAREKVEKLALYYAELSKQGKPFIQRFDRLGQAVNFRQNLHRARKALQGIYGGGDPFSPYRPFYEAEIVLRLPGTDEVPPKDFGGAVELMIRPAGANTALDAVLNSGIAQLPQEVQDSIAAQLQKAPLPERPVSMAQIPESSKDLFSRLFPQAPTPEQAPTKPEEVKTIKFEAEADRTPEQNLAEIYGLVKPEPKPENSDE